MKNLYSTLFLFTTSIFTFAQNQHTVEISRNDYSIIESTYAGTKYTLNSKQYVFKESDYQITEGNNAYKLIYGKGGEKDLAGVRERNKKYLINSFSDTIATIIDKNQEVLIQNTRFSIVKNAQGWNYINEKNETEFSVELFWNKAKWVYTFTYPPNSQISNDLHKVVLLSLVDKAKNLSAPKDDQDLLTNTWFILYLASLNQK